MLNKIGMIILDLIAIVVGLGTLEIINLSFIISQELLVKFTGIVVIIAGLWLAVSAIFWETILQNTYDYVKKIVYMLDIYHKDRQ